MGNVIEVRGLTKRFGNFTAVDRISFNVKEGRFCFQERTVPENHRYTNAVRDKQAQRGTGTVAGFDINKESEKIKRNIGYMSQRSLRGPAGMGEHTALWWHLWPVGKGIAEKRTSY